MAKARSSLFRLDLGTLPTLVHDAFPDMMGDFAYLIFLVAGAAVGLLYVREFKALWEHVREYWVDLRGDPGFAGGTRLLLRKWPYWVTLGMFVVTVCL